MNTMISVLYVDDEPDLLAIGRLFLEQAPGLTVATALSASEALRILDEKRFDAIISDYQMPGMDGLGFLKTLRNRGDPVPFIILTGRGREEVIIEALNSGVDFYLQKGGDPVSQFAELKNIITKSVAQRRAEELRRQSEKRMAEILSHLPEATFAINEEGSVISWNLAIENMTGVPAKEIMGKAGFAYAIPFYGEARPMLLNLIGESNGKLAALGYEEIRREGAALIAETTKAHPGGKSMALWIKATPFYDENGQRAGAIETMRDITSERNAIHALQESEAKYRSIMENIQDVYYRSDENGILVLASPSLATMLGYDSVADLLGKSIAQAAYYHPEEREAFLKEINRKGSITNYEVTLKTREGKPVPVITSSHKYYDASGRFLGIEGIFKDITEQKKILDDLRAAHEQVTAKGEELRARYEELKRGQEALRASEQKLQGIVNGSPIPQFVIDRNHLVVSWNHALEEYSGIRATEILGTAGQWRAFYTTARPCMADLLVDNAVDLIPEWYKGKYSQSRYIEGAFEATDFFPHMRESGTWLYFTAAPIRDERGEIIGAVETLEDITEIRRAEEAIRENEQQYRSLFYDNYSVSLLIDPETGAIVDANAAACTYYGYSLDQLRSRAIYDINHLPKERVLGDLRKAMHEKVKHFFSTHFLASGEERQVEIYSGPITVKGRPLFYSVIHDITDRKRTEEALRSSENLYRTIFENTGAATIIIAPDMKILLANSKWESLTGVRREDQEMKRSWTEFIDQDDVGRMQEYHFARRKDPANVPKMYEARLIDARGKIHSCVVYVDVITGSQNSVASFVDISGLKQAEEGLILINKKLNLMNSITRHDVLNQLTAVSGYLELLRTTVKGDDAQEFIHQGEAAARNIERQILFTAMYQDIGVKNPEWQRVSEVVSQAAGQLSTGAVQIDTDLGRIEVFADPLLVKVFYNLIENAVRYGETITRIRFFAREIAGGLIIVCEDDGIGISVGDKAQIFERGYGRHTGFGLFLAKEILSITGLSIQETGEPGHGARFEIHVPDTRYRRSGTD